MGSERKWWVGVRARAHVCVHMHAQALIKQIFILMWQVFF